VYVSSILTAGKYTRPLKVEDRWCKVGSKGLLAPRTT